VLIVAYLAILGWGILGALLIVAFTSGKEHQNNSRNKRNWVEIVCRYLRRQELGALATVALALATALLAWWTHHERVCRLRLPVVSWG
jgi:hypothetical protein